MKIIDRNESYTFSKYFELKIEAEDLVKEFGYSFAKKYVNLPQFDINLMVKRGSRESEVVLRIYSKPIIIDLFLFLLNLTTIIDLNLSEEHTPNLY